MTQTTCTNCRFWDTPLRAGGYGDCRANAPVAGTEDRWPVSEAHDWCGKWQQISQPNPNDRQIRSSLVERVARAISLDSWDVDPASWTAEARAAIGVIAGELRAQCFVHAADWLERGPGDEP